MTEDEAKSKWCPFARVLSHTYTQQGEFRVTTGYNYNRSPDDEEGYVTPASLCIGSDCMAWRSRGGEMGPTRVHPSVLASAWTGWTITDETPDERGYVEISPPPPSRDGFCGLAGAPL